MKDQWDIDMKPTDYYCPFCGVQAVWTEVGEGDYHIGPVFKCDKCQEEFRGPR